MLRFLMIAMPATLFGYERKDYFEAELVCVHIYHPSQDLPSPLTATYSAPPKRADDGPYFHLGLPELVLCETQTALLDLFQYFWPVERQAVTRLQDRIDIQHQLDKLRGTEDLVRLEQTLKARKHHDPGQATSRAVIFTMNGHTRPLCPRVVALCRKHAVDELVIFKDPSQPPYLCSHPSRQKGFKKPPPIGGTRRTGHGPTIS
jgi:hypothetical protein